MEDIKSGDIVKLTNLPHDWTGEFGELLYLIIRQTGRNTGNGFDMSTYAISRMQRDNGQFEILSQSWGINSQRTLPYKIDGSHKLNFRWSAPLT